MHGGWRKRRMGISRSRRQNAMTRAQSTSHSLSHRRFITNRCLQRASLALASSLSPSRLAYPASSHPAKLSTITPQLSSIPHAAQPATRIETKQTLSPTIVTSDEKREWRADDRSPTQIHHVFLRRFRPVEMKLITVYTLIAVCVSASIATQKKGKQSFLTSICFFLRFLPFFTILFSIIVSPRIEFYVSEIIFR